MYIIGINPARNIYKSNEYAHKAVIKSFVLLQAQNAYRLLELLNQPRFIADLKIATTECLPCMKLN